RPSATNAPAKQRRIQVKTCGREMTGDVSRRRTARSQRTPRRSSHEEAQRQHAREAIRRVSRDELRQEGEEEYRQLRTADALLPHVEAALFPQRLPRRVQQAQVLERLERERTGVQQSREANAALPQTATLRASSSSSA